MREFSLQNAFIQAVDRCRLLTQRNRGVALDCHYSEYSSHYNLCNDLARRIKEAVGGIHSAANMQLRQQFVMQFSNNESSQVPLVRSQSQRYSQNLGSEEDQRMLFEQLKKASEPLNLSQRGDFDAISDGMESVMSTSEDDFESIKDSSEEDRTVSFESIDDSSESGTLWRIQRSADNPAERPEEDMDASILSDVLCEWSVSCMPRSLVQ